MRIAVLLLAVASALSALSDVDVYNFKMRVRVPRIYNNTESRGQRKWQTQIIRGQMIVDYDTDSEAPVVTFENCYNQTHTIDGRPITYLCEQGYDEVVRRWVVMGSNMTGSFRYASCFFFADFDPSYNIGEDEPDSSLLLYFGGYGTLSQVAKRPCAPASSECGGTTWKVTRWRGYCVGTMGCGCSAYGHISPTRVLGFCGPICDMVTDVAAIPIGQWTAVYKSSH